jgi:DinB family protein
LLDKTRFMTGRPGADEAAPYYFRYIDLVGGEDPVAVLETQLDETTGFLSSISEDGSRSRYAPDKWSIRQIASHINDTERVFVSRAFWFARNFDSPLPSYDQNTDAAAVGADDVPWKGHVEEFGAVRLATLYFFRHLPAEAFLRRGIASGNLFTVRALAYILAGHVIHHSAVIRERYLGGQSRV